MSATVTPVAVDNDGVSNIVSAFFPTTISLVAGGSDATAYSGSTVKIGRSPNPANTATGNYTVTITATSGGISHSATLFDMPPLVAVSLDRKSTRLNSSHT